MVTVVGEAWDMDNIIFLYLSALANTGNPGSGICSIYNLFHCCKVIRTAWE